MTDMAMDGRGIFMSQEQWTAVDQYIDELFIPPDEALDLALATSSAAGLPPHNVSPSQGKFLQLLVRVRGARSILEIGTLGGYSTIWMARGLPSDSRLVTLEADSKHAEVAKANLSRAGLSGIVEVRIGPALDTLPRLESEKCGPFDLIFIDADKRNNPEYFKWALRLSRPGSLIIVDNVIRNGAVVNATSEDPNVLGVRRLNVLLTAEKRVSATTIQTVGSKGYDGFTMALVNEDNLAVSARTSFSPRTFISDSDIIEIGKGLLDHSLPKKRWTHEAHFAAVVYLLKFEPSISLESQLPSIISRYNEAKGGQNTDSAGYHETLTQFYIRLVKAYLDSAKSDAALHEICNSLVSSPSANRDFPLKFYSQEYLFSVKARREWVEPDLSPLNF